MLRARIYDAAIVGLTSSWYEAVFDRLPIGARMLDVGVGTGGALAANAGLVGDKDLRVVGIDIDRAYVERCRERMHSSSLDTRVEIRLESVYDHTGGPYDAVYFSASFMLLPDPVAALRHVSAMLAPDGRLFFTQTFEDRPSRMMEIVKPLLRFVTTIDFGQVTYEESFRAALAAAGAPIDEMLTLGSETRRSSRLIVARPAARNLEGV